MSSRPVTDPLAPVRQQLATGDLAAAELTCRAALGGAPQDPRAHGLLAHVLQRAGRHEDAYAAASRSLELAPEFVPSLLELAAAARALQRYGDARDALERLLRLAPARAPLHYDLGVVLLELGEVGAARASFERALALDRDLADAYFKLGLLDLVDNAVASAYAHFTRCTEVRPGFIEGWINRAECLCRTGQFEDAIVAAQRALELAPDRVESLRAYGRALLGAKKDYAEWVWVKRRLVELDPSPLSRIELALALWEGYFYREAAEVLDSAIADFPDYWPARWGRFQHPLTPFPVDESFARDYLATWRAGLEEMERRFAAQPDKPEARQCVRLATNFYLHYLGEPFVEEQRRYGALVTLAMRHAFAGLPAPKPIAPPGRRRRIGFASAYFRKHTVNKLFAPLIAALDRERFEVCAFMFEEKLDEHSEWLRARVDRFVSDAADLDTWVRHLGEAALDVLVFVDLGMHPLAQSLGALRFAPVQCVAWGHPITTGLPSIDYFLSSDAMEPVDGESHYTEELVRLPNLGIAYEPPSEVPARPESFVPNDAAEPVDFFFAQTVYKVTAIHDEVFARIAQALPGMRIHMLPHPQRHVRDQLAARMRGAFEARGLDFERHVVIHPPQPLAGFLGIAAACDVNLDSIGWSGGNTTLEILWHDVPTLTLPGKVMRARHTGGMLELLGLDELIATDVDDFVERAIRLGRDKALRERLAATIRERKHRLYRDRAAVDGMNDFLANVMPRARSRPA